MVDLQCGIPLQPHIDSGGFEPISAPQNPVWSFHYAERDNLRRLTVYGNSWSQDTSGTTYFSVLGITQTRNAIAYHTMNPLSNQPDDDIPSSIPVLMSSSTVIDKPQAAGEFFVSGNRLVQPWTTTDEPLGSGVAVWLEATSRRITTSKVGGQLFLYASD